jgi:hypothetical protein
VRETSSIPSTDAFHFIQESTMNVRISIAVAAATAAFAGNACAIDRAEMDRQAQRAYEASARDYNEVAEQAQKWHDGAVWVRDRAIDLLTR